MPITPVTAGRGPGGLSVGAMRSDSLRGDFADHAGRLDHHKENYHSERENILVRSERWHRDDDDDLQQCEQEAAEYRAVDVAEPTHHRGAEPDDAKHESGAEIDLVVVQPVH